MKVSDLSPKEIAHALSGSGLRLRTGPFVVELSSPLPAIHHGMGLLYADFPLAEPALGGFADFHLRFAPRHGLRRWYKPQVWFYFDGFTPFRPLPVGQAMPMFEWCLNWCIANHMHQYLVIHAAVVERHGRAAILTAPPGSGKSTLCAALCQRGWRLLSDELCLLDRRDGLVYPLARPVSLKNQSIDIIRAFSPRVVIGPVSHDTTKGDVAHLKPAASCVAAMRQPATPAWIIFPRYQAQAATQIKPRQKGLTFLRIADYAFNYSLLGSAGFHAMADLLERCECFDFTYSQLSEAIAWFDTLANPGGVAP